jgi:hypothetical protein
MTYTTRQLKVELRDGQYAWPGGYERTYVTSDGEVLCHTCVLANLREIFTAMHEANRNLHECSGWRIEGCQSTEYYEPTETTTCAHCYRVIVEQTEPDVDNGDITTKDYHTFYQYGKFAAYVPDDVDWQPVLRMHMELTSYYPSVWHCSDHGNWTLLNAQEDAA